MPPQPPPAIALLVFATLLAGFAAAVRAHSGVDRRQRPALLAAGVAAGAVALAVGLAPLVLGAAVLSPELAGVCLAWAGRAAGRLDSEGQFVATTTLLAAYLGMASGDLPAAKSALAAVPDVSRDADLAATLLLGRCLLAYLQGWSDSAIE